MNEVDQHEKLRQETLYSVKSDIDELRSEIHYDLPSKSNIEGTILFDKMLTLDVNNFSVKGVNFDIENAYFNNKADKSQFDQIIHHTGEFLTAKMKELKYDHNSNSAKNYILFQFFSEEMKLGKQTHLPFKYDFEDYMGVKDYSKMFVSKLLSTGSGQCHSLPLLYLILAEEIGAEAYLSLSPNHSYIRFPDDRGKWYNIELTNGMFSTESYISQSGYIKSEALQNKIYMENLSKKELLSKHFSDLAEGYIHKFGYNEFAQSVIDKALELYPNSISANMINANLATVRVKYVVQQLGINISDAKERERILNYPKAVELLKEMQKQYAVIDNLGYENMPPEEYQKWLRSMKGEKQREENKAIEKKFKGAIIKSTKELMKINLLIIFYLIFSVSVKAQSQETLYMDSFITLNSMLVDGSKYNFKQAVLSVENAYLNGTLDIVKVDKKIRALTVLCNSLVENRFLAYVENDKKDVNKWAAAYQVMCDSIPIIINNKEYNYIPFKYDFNDVFGNEDISNMFVSKLLNSRKGNCHSLPYLYKILCEEQGTTAQLALAPNHVYIKHQNKKNGWYNTELTSGIFPNDSWLMVSGFIHLDAIRNGVYMKALNNNESFK